MLINYPHKLLCLDESKLLQKELRGEQILLVSSIHSDTEIPFSQRLVVSVNLSDTGPKPILLEVDSGSDAHILYAGKKDPDQPLLKRARFQGAEVSEARRRYAVLPVPQGARSEEHGLLATMIFQRVFISHSDRFLIFDPM